MEGGVPSGWRKAAGLARAAEVHLSSGTACDSENRAQNDKFSHGVQHVVK